MKNTINKRISSLVAMVLMTVIYASAQESPQVKVNGKDVGTWFGNNWIWVAGLVLLLLIILLFSGRNRNKRSSTTVVSDRFGDVRKTSTTETEVE